MQIKKLCFSVVLMLFAVTVHAEYQLNNDSSSLNFISIKKSKVGEIHTFKKLSGSITSDGIAQVTIELASVETNIDIRNERMKTLLLETGLFPTAVVSATLDNAQLKAIGVGDAVMMPVQLTLELHGKSNVMDVQLQVVGLANGGLLVSTVKPMLLRASNFGLVGGIVKLMEVAKLPVIATAVPVTFNLKFTLQ